MKRILILTLIFYFLVILETSFFAHFRIFWFIPNFIIILTIIINIFDKEKNFFSIGILSAMIGGFFLDLFSSQFIGYYILILTGISLIIKIFLKRYVRIPINR